VSNQPHLVFASHFPLTITVSVQVKIGETGSRPGLVRGMGLALFTVEIQQSLLMYVNESDYC
jgi:hypothetical protein